MASAQGHDSVRVAAAAVHGSPRRKGTTARGHGTVRSQGHGGTRLEPLWHTAALAQGRGGGRDCTQLFLAAEKQEWIWYIPFKMRLYLPLETLFVVVRTRLLGYNLLIPALMVTAVGERRW